VAVLIAGRRLTTDARAAGRAAAAVGAIALVAGGGGVLLSDLPNSYQGGDFGDVEAFYTVPIAVGGVVLLAALLLVIFSMAVHGVESLIDRKRSVAALAALGGSAQDLQAAQRWEVGLVAVPMAVIGVLIGSVPYWLLVGDGSNRYAWIPLVVDCATVALVWLAVRASSWITRPWLLRAAAATNLRTP
jgi:predicted lysophospholipase L1 biosynthesis ABC-type transport system permease subunit